MKFSVHLFVIATLLGMNSAQSQKVTLGSTANVGLSKPMSYRSTSSGDLQVKFAVSGNVGMFLEKEFSEKSSFGFEALWVQFEGNEVTNNWIWREWNGQEVEEIGIISYQDRLHASYFGLPIYYRHNFGKVGIKFGAQPLLFLYASSSYAMNGSLRGEPYESNGKTKNLKIAVLDHGPKIGVDYQMSSAFRLRADFYHAVTNITSGMFLRSRRNMQITAGLVYVFGNEKE